HDADIVGAGAVPLQHRELRIVAADEGFAVPEALAELIGLRETRGEQLLQRVLRTGDEEGRKSMAERIADDGLEWIEVRLHPGLGDDERRLDFHVAARVEESANGREDTDAHAE